MAGLIPTDLPSPFNEDLAALETLDDETLWQVAYSRLSAYNQDLYSELLEKIVLESLRQQRLKPFMH